MAHYILNLGATLVAFVGAGIIITLLLFLREKRIIKKLGGLKVKVNLSIKWLKIMIIAITIVFGLLLIGLVFVFIYVNSIELELRLIFQMIFLSAMLVDSFIFSKLLICKNGFAGFGIPAVYWDEIKKVEWDRDVGQELRGLKILIFSMRSPFRFFIPRKFKKDLEELFRKRTDI